MLLLFFWKGQVSDQATLINVACDYEIQMQMYHPWLVKLFKVQIGWTANFTLKMRENQVF